MSKMPSRGPRAVRRHDLASGLILPVEILLKRRGAHSRAVRKR